jgi:hypothetical protein
MLHNILETFSSKHIKEIYNTRTIFDIKTWKIKN